jgi:hypothetical protein
VTPFRPVLLPATALAPGGAAEDAASRKRRKSWFETLFGFEEHGCTGGVAEAKGYGENREKDPVLEATIHAVGLGLGVWQMGPSYNQMLLKHRLSNVPDIDFSWMPDTEPPGSRATPNPDESSAGAVKKRYCRGSAWTPGRSPISISTRW